MKSSIKILEKLIDSDRTTVTPRELDAITYILRIAKQSFIPISVNHFIREERAFASRNAMPLPITTAAVAEEIGVSRSTLYNWIEAGLLKAHYRFWFPEEVERARKLKGKLRAGRPSKLQSLQSIPRCHYCDRTDHATENHYR